VDDQTAYGRLRELSDSRLDKLIDLLTVECVTAHLQRRTDLIHHLSVELKVDIRQFWRPDAVWLAGYQKIQLAHLLAELHGSIYNPASESRKKTELVEVLARIFSDAAEDKLEDKQLAERVNQWLPANLREVKEEVVKRSQVGSKKRSWISRRSHHGPAFYFLYNKHRIDPNIVLRMVGKNHHFIADMKTAGAALCAPSKLSENPSC